MNTASVLFDEALVMVLTVAIIWVCLQIIFLLHCAKGELVSACRRMACVTCITYTILLLFDAMEEFRLISPAWYASFRRIPARIVILYGFLTAFYILLPPRKATRKPSISRPSNTTEPTP